MSDREKLIELIPLYLNGTLSKEEKKEFEESLKSSPFLQQELDDFKEIKEFYADISEELPEPSPVLFDRILQGIESEEKRAFQKQSAFSLKPALEFIKRLFKVPAFSWGVAGVQFAIILFLISGISRNQRYETLSSSRIVLENKIAFKVVFNETAKELEIRDLILSVGGQIVSGPSPVGAYTVTLSSTEVDPGEVLDKLKTSSIVRFAASSF